MKLLQLGKVITSEPVRKRMERNIGFFLAVKLALDAYENGIFDENSVQHLDEIKNNREVRAVYSFNTDKIAITTSSNRKHTIINMA